MVHFMFVMVVVVWKGKGRGLGLALDSVKGVALDNYWEKKNKKSYVGHKREHRETKRE